MTRHVSARGRVTYYSKTDPHAVYHVFDRHERVIYIGSSYDPDARLDTHRAEQPWRAEIFRWETEWYSNWSAVNAAEHAAIWREDPDHNKVGTPLDAIVNRCRYSRQHLVDEARACRSERIAAEKANDLAAALAANMKFQEIAMASGIQANRVRLIAAARFESLEEAS